MKTLPCRATDIVKRITQKHLHCRATDIVKRIIQKQKQKEEEIRIKKEKIKNNLDNF